VEPAATLVAVRLVEELAAEQVCVWSQLSELIELLTHLATAGGSAGIGGGGSVGGGSGGGATGSNGGSVRHPSQLVEMGSQLTYS
jgi:hypothetical protein